VNFYFQEFLAWYLIDTGWFSQDFFFFFFNEDEHYYITHIGMGIIFFETHDLLTWKIMGCNMLCNYSMKICPGFSLVLGGYHNFMLMSNIKAWLTQSNLQKGLRLPPKKNSTSSRHINILKNKLNRSSQCQFSNIWK
jgi:hypothetical protein